MAVLIPKRTFDAFWNDALPCQRRLTDDGHELHITQTTMSGDIRTVIRCDSSAIEMNDPRKVGQVSEA